MTRTSTRCSGGTARRGGAAGVSLAPRRMLRWGIVLAGALSSGACLVPEYYIDEGSSGGSTGSGGDEGSGGGTQSGTGGGSTPGDGGSSGGDTGGSGGTTGDGGAPSGGGTGGISADWSCADEAPNPPEYFSNGVVCGYVYPFAAPEDSIDFDWECAVGTGSACETEEDRYLVATIPPWSPPVYPVVGLGFRLAQHPSGAVPGRHELSGYGLSLDYVTEGATATGRVQLVSDGDVYCAQATPGTALAWEDFRLECWDATSTATLNGGDLVDELQVTVGANDAEQTITEFDILDLTLHEEEPPFVCDGCARLFVPLEGEGVDAATVYHFDLGDEYDMSDPDLRLVARVYVETAGTTGGLQLVLRSAGAGEPTVFFWSQLAEVKGWHDIVAIPSGPAGENGFDPNEVDAIGIQVTAGTPPADTVLGDTIVYLDSLTFTGATSSTMPSFAFDDSLEGFAMGDSVPGSTIEWVSLP